jgi:hypothetical protein
MLRVCAFAGLMAMLSLGSTPVLAFQETPVPPAEGQEAAPAPQAAAPSLQLANPGTAPVTPADKQGGIKVFGYTLLPKLNFGLDVLYGQDEQQLQMQQGPTALDENGDVSVLGKVKRRF